MALLAIGFVIGAYTNSKIRDKFETVGGMCTAIKRWFKRAD